MKLTADPTRAGVSLRPLPSSRSEFIGRALDGRMREEDVAYMARALLQLSDDCAVLRERVRVLEAWRDAKMSEII